LRSVITSFSGSFGSTSPKATPLSVSYCPTAPKEAPPKATARESIWILVMRASAGSPMPARATGSRLTNAARTNGLMVLSSSRTMLLVCAAPMQPRPRTAASFMRNASEPAGEEEKMTTRREFVSQAAALTGIAFMGCDGLPAARAQAPRRREVVVSGRRVKTVDVHAHCGVPEAMALMGLKLAPASLVMADERIRRMDEQGIDVEALSVLIFIHPQGTDELKSRLRGNGGLENTIGNPLETTLALSHLIFEGTLERFPGLKICAAHGGGYLPSYAPRSDHICLTFPE